MQSSRLFLTGILIFILNTLSFSQDEQFTSSTNRRGDYSLVLYVNAGLGYYGSNEGAPGYLHPVHKKTHGVGTFRVMWHPDHLLKVGIETGYLTFYSYKFEDSLRNSGKVALNAIPVLIEYSMSLNKRINVFAGSGIYFLNTRLDYQGKSSSNKLSAGWVLAASYIQPVSLNMGIGTELKWLYASETTLGSICVQVQLVYKFLKW